MPCKLKLPDWRVDDREHRVEFRQQHDMHLCRGVYRRLQVFVGLTNFDPGTVYEGVYVLRASKTVGQEYRQC